VDLRKNDMARLDRASSHIRYFGIGIISLALLSLLVALLPASLLSDVARSIAHRAIRADRFALYHSGMFYLAAYLGGCGMLFLAAASSVWHLITELRPRRLWPFIRRVVFHDEVYKPRLHYCLVVSLLLGGLWVRLLFLNRPIRTDEAASYLAFASRPLLVGLADYSMPNNHLLNTLLMGIATRLFGVHEWSVRLPVLLFGMLLLVGVYAAGRALCSYRAGLLALGLVAASPRLVEYSINARGYMFICVSTICCLVLVLSALRHAEAGPEPGFIALACAIGLCAVPTMLLAVVAIGMWWFASELKVGGIRRFAKCIHRIIVPGMLATVAVIGFYLPAVIYSGPQKILSNRYVLPLPKDQLWPTARVVAENAWASWNQPIPRILVFLLLAAAIIGLIQGLRVKCTALPPLAIFLVSTIGYCLGRRVVPPERAWLFILPLYLIRAAIGIDAAGEFFSRKASEILVAAATVVSFGVSTIAIVRGNTNCWTDPFGIVSNARELSDVLAANIKTNDEVSFIDGYHSVLFTAIQHHPSLAQILLHPSSSPRRKFLVIGKFPSVEPFPELGCATTSDADSEKLRKQFIEKGMASPDVIQSVLARVTQLIATDGEPNPAVRAFLDDGPEAIRVFVAFPGTTVLIRDVPGPQKN